MRESGSAGLDGGGLTVLTHTYSACSVTHVAVSVPPLQSRVRYTCDGPQEVWLRPNGSPLFSRSEVVALVNTVLTAPPPPSAAAVAAAATAAGAGGSGTAAARVAGGGVTYEQVFLLRPGQLTLGGLRLSLSDAEDDVVNELLAASVRVRKSRAQDRACSGVCTYSGWGAQAHGYVQVIARGAGQYGICWGGAGFISGW